MLLTKDNSDIAILQAAVDSGHRFYDPNHRMIFSASPCEHCGVMSAHGNPIRIEQVSDALHRSLYKLFGILDFVEVVGYDDEGVERCDACYDDDDWED